MVGGRPGSNAGGRLRPSGVGDFKVTIGTSRPVSAPPAGHERHVVRSAPRSRQPAIDFGSLSFRCAHLSRRRQPRRTLYTPRA